MSAAKSFTNKLPILLGCLECWVWFNTSVLYIFACYLAQFKIQDFQQGLAIMGCHIIR